MNTIKKLKLLVLVAVLFAAMCKVTNAQTLFEVMNNTDLNYLEKNGFSSYPTFYDIKNPGSILHFYITNFENNNPYPFYGWLTDTINPWVIDTTNPSNIWQIGKPNKVNFDSAYTVPFAMVTDTINSYPINNHSTFQFNVKKPWWNMYRGWSFLILIFDHNYDTDTLCDGGYIDVSYDGGHTFTNIILDKQLVSNMGGQYSVDDTIKGGMSAFSGKSKGWESAQFLLEWWPEETWSEVDSMIVRFNFKSDSIDNEKAGWLIDNIYFRVEGYIGIGIDDLVNCKTLNIYPNPVKNILIIDWDVEQKISRIDIYALNGKSVWSKSKFDYEDHCIINFQNKPAGIYILKTTYNNYKTNTIKFIKE